MTSEPVNSAIASKRLWPTFPAIILALLCFFPSSAQKMKNQPSSQTGIDQQCIANLKRIGELIKLRIHHSGGERGFPSNLYKLRLMTHNLNLFLCPNDKEIGTSEKESNFRTSYELVNNPFKPELSATPHDKIAIIAEKRPNHNGKRFVLFYDGSVRAFDEAQFNELKNNSFIVRN